MYQFSFEKLTAYQFSKKLVRDVYNLLEKFPNTEKYGLCSQIQRSIVSVPSNIAEQSGRISKKERAHFIEISYGSLMEAYCQLEIAVELKYIDDIEFQTLKPQFMEIAKMLSGLRRSFIEQSSN
ncbi:MAG: four helix bundle protein [Muribaculaceae bacterium]|nr:four helix bundle protein [Muribaculaceae bacterium]